jgi:hypothetical protein
MQHAPCNGYSGSQNNSLVLCGSGYNNKIQLASVRVETDNIDIEHLIIVDGAAEYGL